MKSCAFACPRPRLVEWYRFIDSIYDTSATIWIGMDRHWIKVPYVATYWRAQNENQYHMAAPNVTWALLKSCLQQTYICFKVNKVGDKNIYKLVPWACVALWTFVSFSTSPLSIFSQSELVVHRWPERLLRTRCNISPEFWQASFRVFIDLPASFLLKPFQEHG